MVVIDRNRCVGCGRCAAIPISLKCIKEQDGYELYEDPPDSQMAFVNKILQECQTQCIHIV